MKYTLEKYKTIKSRYTCPECSKQRVFSRYINTETQVHLSAVVGRCNRESKCGYHYKPKQYFADNPTLSDTPIHPTKFKPEIKPISFIDRVIFNKSQEVKDCNFSLFIYELFGQHMGKGILDKYKVSRSSNWKGATVFWQIDILDRIRTGKIMLYDVISGKRIKKPYNHITWVHKVLKESDFNLEQCFFGEHLLKDKTKPVAIVESEKTALIASGFFSDFIWLASGSLNNLNEKKCKVLHGRNVTLFPDAGCFKQWNDKAIELKAIPSFKVSDLLEGMDEIKEGQDLADYLLNINKITQ